MNELLILAAIMESKEAYDTFQRIGEVQDFGPLASAVLGVVGEYYEVDSNAHSVNREFIEGRLLRDVKNSKHEQPLRDFIRSIPANTSASNIEQELRELHKQRVGGKLSLALANGAPEAEVQKLIHSYSQGATSDVGLAPIVDIFSEEYLTSLTDKGNDNDYIKLWPKQLNDRLDGGALRGHHILVFARPEAGKTLFSINLCAGFLHQSLNVLYVANEEPAADYRDRIYGRLLKTSKNDVRRDRAESARRLAAVRLGTLAIIEGTDFARVRASLAGSAASIRGDAARWDVVVLDQVRNMRVKSDSRTAELEASGIEARAIAKEFNVLVVSVTQAGDSASGKVYLEMSDVDSSKTGIPASADLMVGIGADEAMKVNGTLGISLPKNKLSGLHDKFSVTVNFSTGVIS